MSPNTKTYDVIVIGGGPSGMMVAITASQNGAKVLLIEKNKRLGEKLLITGGGRCNLTNNELDAHKLLAKYKEAKDFLFSPFSLFNVKSTLEFFNNEGVATKVENEGRVFPTSDKAESIWNVLVELLKRHKVEVISNTRVTRIAQAKNTITHIETSKGIFEAENYILATGGLSHPETGSTGDGFKWLKDLGHTVKEPNASLVPLKTKTDWVPLLQGVTLPEAKITVLYKNTKQKPKKGKILFTHFGVTGPTILNMSNDIGDKLNFGNVSLSIDLLPAFDHSQLNEKLQTIFKTEHSKKIKNALGSLFVSSLVEILLRETHIDLDKECHSITREERMKLIDTIKNLVIEIEGLMGKDKAIVTSGGIALEEVDFRTMRSKKIHNLFVVGDILDINRPSGGYSLQLCWTTGYVAGKHSAEK